MRLERELLAREQAKDLVWYAPTNLKIRTESDGIQPFTFNEVQLFIHSKLETQLKKTGRVRALILKARKQGCSTYVAARFYRKTRHNHGIQTTIIAHEQGASDTLFGIVNLFYENDPRPPAIKGANAKELNFADLNSGYGVLTAGTKDTGRSQTPQNLHSSEFGFWPNAKIHLAGIIQAVPEADGTEVIIESTANGMGDAFHQMWQMAEKGESDYVAIFIPWFMTKHYRRKVPAGFALDEEEQKYRELHRLDLEQMAWRRAKMQIPDGENIFRREYPATAAEAFASTGDRSFIRPASVLDARKTTRDGIGPLIIGADPARFGDDRFSLAYRRGRKLLKVESKTKLDVVAGANWIKQVIDVERPARVFIDVGGLGAGVYDILAAWGDPYDDICVAVNFGGAPQEPEIWIRVGDKLEKRPGPKNRRAEMWMRLRDWLDQVGGVDIPDSDTLQTDLTGPEYKYDMNQRLVLEEKEHMRARGLLSCDEGDATALTFAEPVADVAKQGPPLVRPRGRDRLVGV